MTAETLVEYGSHWMQTDFRVLSALNADFSQSIVHTE